jgi:tetratricopeptide (TPR) repeat protein
MIRLLNKKVLTIVPVSVIFVAVFIVVNGFDVVIGQTGEDVSGTDVGQSSEVTVAPQTGPEVDQSGIPVDKAGDLPDVAVSPQPVDILKALENAEENAHKAAVGVDRPGSDQAPKVPEAKSSAEVAEPETSDPGNTPKVIESTDSAKGTDLDALIKQAGDLEKQGKLAESLELHKMVLKKLPASGNKKVIASVLSGAARVSHRLGSNKEALAYINQSIELNNALKNARARSVDHILAARILMAESNYAPALESLQEALKILPTSEAAEMPDLLELIASCQIKLLRYSDAFKSLNRLLSMYSKDGNQLEIARVNLRIGEVQVSRFDYRTATDHFRRAEKVYRDLKRKKELGETLFGIAYLEQTLGDIKGAQKTIEEAKTFLTGQENAESAAFPSMVKGMNAYHQGKTVQAINYLSRALSLYETSGDSLMAARVRLALANIHLDRSRSKPALELAGKSLEEFRSKSAIGGEAAALLLIGEVYFRQGFVQKALEYVREASALSKKINDRDQMVQARIVLAEIHSSLGDIEFTSKLLKEAIDDSKVGINTRTRGNLRLSVARFKLSRESLDKALQDAADARKDFVEINDLRGIADSDHLVGLAHEMRGEQENALRLLQKALEEHRSIGDRLGEGRDLTALGVHYKNQGDYDKAMEYFSEALELRRGIGDRRGYAANLANIGNILRLRNQVPEAQHNLEQALTVFKELSDKKGEADSLTNLGHVDAARGMQSAALERFAAALKLHREIKDNRGAATDLANMGRIYLAKGNLENASSALEEAAKLNKVIRNPRGEVAILSELAMLQRAKNNSAGALSLLNRALELARQTADARAVASINLKMATVLEDTGDYNKALELLRLTLSTMKQQGDRKGELWALGGIGVIQVKTEDYENALQNLLEAQRLRTELGIPASQSRELDFHLGEIYEGFRDFERALEHYQKALTILQNPGNESVLARIYDRIGNIYYSMEEYSKAKDFYEDALRMSTETRNISLQKSQLIRLGDISSKLGDAETALKYQQRALVLSRETHDGQTEARILTRMGTLNQVLGRPRVALDHYGEAKDIHTKLGDRRGVNENLLQIALVTSTLGDSETAVEDLKKAFEISQASEDRSMLWKAYFIMGRTLESKKTPGEALESYRKAIAILEAMEAETVEMSDDDDFIFGGKTALFETALRVLMSLARKDPGGAYDNQALRIVEKLKAVSFEKTLSAINVDSFSDLPNELLIKEKSLKLSLRKLNERLEEERSKVNPNQSQIRKLLDERRAKEKSFKQLKERLLAEYPAYSELRYPRPITVHQLQKDVIDQDEAVLQYMVTRSRTYVFALDKQRFHTYSIDYSGNDIEKDIDALTRPLHRADTQASWDPSVAYRVYSKIIKPIEYFLVGKKSVVIIPHGPLSSLPFEILVDSKTHAARRFWSATDRPSYLVEKYAFSYAPSASILTQIRTRSRERKPGWNLVAFGDADYADSQKTKNPNPGSEKLMNSMNISSGGSRGQDLRPLPGARKEISEIVRIMGGPTQTYVGPLATETLFKKVDLARYGYVHLATHGVLLSGAGKFQQRPAIIFSLYGDKENDGFLQLGEVFGLRLNSDLVVLSSCLTPGKIDLGDSSGLTGLARAFLFAGTDSVILSMWQVNDESTANLFIELYRNLKDGSKAEALRAAKLALLKNSGTSHPYYWGPFILMGDWHVRLHPSYNRPAPETVRFKGLSNWRKLLSF